MYHSSTSLHCLACAHTAGCCMLLAPYLRGQRWAAQWCCAPRRLCWSCSGRNRHPAAPHLWAAGSHPGRRCTAAHAAPRPAGAARPSCTSPPNSRVPRAPSSPQRLREPSRCASSCSGWSRCRSRRPAACCRPGLRVRRRWRWWWAAARCCCCCRHLLLGAHLANTGNIPLQKSHTLYYSSLILTMQRTESLYFIFIVPSSLSFLIVIILTFNKVTTDSWWWEVLNRILAWNAAARHLQYLSEDDVIAEK